MRLITTSIFVLFFATSLFADQKNDILTGLAKGKSAFESPGNFKSDADNAKAWTDAVAGIVVLVPKSDKTLSKGYEDLWQANKILVNTFSILLPQCINLDKFGQAETRAINAQKALNKASFIIPAKRSAREVLVKLADYIVTAAKIGVERGKICKGLETITLLANLQMKLSDVEAARKGVHKNINETEQAKRNYEAVKQKLADWRYAEEEYIQSTTKTLESLKIKESENKQIIENLKTELATTEAARKEVDGYLFETQEAALKRVEEGRIKEEMARLQRAIETIVSSQKKIEATLKGKVDEFSKGREQARKEENRAFQMTIAAITQTLEGGNKAQSVLDAYKKLEERAKIACGIKQATGSTIETCRTKTLGKIKEAATAAMLPKQCSLEKESGQRDIDRCATAAGKV